MYRILEGDAMEMLRTLPDENVQCCITSPPYWGLRDYKVESQIGLEKTPEEYIAKMVAVFHEVWRVLRNDGTLWLNIGDSYANDGKWGGSTGGKHVSALNGEPIGCGKRNTGLKPKDLVGIPWMLAFALRADGWYLRQDIIWAKPNPMPESVTDRCTKSHEYLFLLAKSQRYYYDQEAIKEPAAESSLQRWDQDIENQSGSDRVPGKTNGPMKAVGGRAAGNKTHKTVAEYERSDSEEHRTAAGLLKIANTPYPMRNKRSVWTITTQPYREAHFATFPEALVEPCILAGSKPDDTVLDCYMGSGTTGAVALRHGRNFIGIDLNPAYVVMARERIENDAPLFNHSESQLSTVSEGVGD
jgi:DNA modification methylase